MRFLLSVPVIPWCRDKYLEREALRSYLPQEIVDRPKESLAGFPAYERWKEVGLPAGLLTEGLEPYVNTECLESTRIDGQAILAMKLRAFALAFFLRDLGHPCIMGGT
jgi:hypothetical protein